MNNNKLDPNFMTGFTAAEGCFYVRIAKSNSHKIGWLVQACFQISLHIRDKDLLLQIKSFFSEIGTVLINYNHNFASYKICSLDDITNVIIPHFDKYQLITQKYSDFIIFKNIVELMNKDQHLNKDGLIKIINLKTSLNKGLSDELKINFPNAIKVERSKVNIPTNISYNWIAGFFSGEGCFSVNIYNSNDHKIGHGVSLQVIFTQHSRDEVLFNNIKKLLGCGNIYKRSKINIIDLRISNFKDTYYKMIPLFNKHKIIGVKSLDFQDFCKVAELVNKKDHLTREGLEKIYKIKSNMNRSRYVLYNNELYKTK